MGIIIALPIDTVYRFNGVARGVLGAGGGTFRGAALCWSKINFWKGLKVLAFRYYFLINFCKI